MIGDHLSSSAVPLYASSLPSVCRGGTKGRVIHLKRMSHHLTPEILALIEDGKLPMEIARRVLNTDDDTLRPGEKLDGESEMFPEEMITISQALAYRRANLDDVSRIFEVLKSSYAAEINGSESFRRDEPVMSSDDILLSIREGSFSWLIVEVPEGRGTRADGSAIAVCAFTTDGISRRNGEVEGNLGSIRLFALLPQYHGLQIGVRFLDKVELEMKKLNGCVRMMCSIPSTRKSMLKWVERQQFLFAGIIPYPSGLGHTLKVNDVKLHVYLRAIRYSRLDKSMMDADAKNPTEIETVLKLNIKSDVNDNTQIEFTNRKLLNLPPHWRQEAYNKNITPTTNVLEDELVPMVD